MENPVWLKDRKIDGRKDKKEEGQTFKGWSQLKGNVKIACCSNCSYQDATHKQFQQGAHNQ